MFLSSASLITVVVLFNLSVIVLWFYLKSHKRIIQISINTLLLGILLVLLRLLVPMEFVFQKTVGERYLFPGLFLVLYTPILEFITPSIYVYYVFLFIWGIGSVVLAIRAAVGYMKFRCLINQEPHLNGKKILKILKSIEELNGKLTKFKIIRTGIVSVPMFFGLFTPRIILPEVELSGEELCYILRHEVTHYYKHDLWIKLLVELISIIYWWNPLVYILKQEIDKILEIRVDMIVTKTFNEAEKINYLECLLKIAKETAPSQISGFSLAFDSRTVSVLSQRFHIILDGRSHKKSGIKNSLLFIFMIFILIFSLFVVIEPYSIALEDQQNTLELTAETAFLVVNPDEGYDIYVNDTYFATATEIRDSYSNLSIYNNLEEALFNESKK
ncbi:M56 family metallopeptidase [Clostridium sp. Marseille-P2415]|uniref:M56 family metallopeptidase n=1 Tax=Clostridium sp. Marseille-P2415 TaxID=1805471 RepID=UPI0009888683|nr:M56 family metallopeptidase [Clostridium sp. Marseille-P2415]